MKSKKMLATLVMASIASVGFVMSASADEKTDVFPITVVGQMDPAENTYDGQVIRTGGDVTVITREEIENKHYDNVTDAIRNVPGVEVKSPGYRGIEYGNAYTGSTIAINGDNRVVFCVDGKRMGSDAITSNMSERTKGEVALLMGMVNIERIEVVRGAAAMAYGSDATGGVINIITKKVDGNYTNIDLATGSWGKHKGSIANMGKVDKFSYIVSASRDRGKDTKYKDHYLNQTKTFKCTNYKEDTAYVKLDYQFDKDRALTFSHTFINNKGGYPIFAPDYEWEGAVNDYLATGNKAEGVTNPSNRWHRWWYYYGDAIMGSYSKVRANNMDLTYSFAELDGVKSYLRIYQNKNEHYMKRYRGKNDLSGFDRLDIADHEEDVRGVELRMGQKLNSKDILYGGITYQHSIYDKLDIDTNVSTNNITRDSLSAFIQDKIKLGRKLTITPGLRYQWTGDSEKNGVTNAEGTSHTTMGAFGQYKFDSTASMHFSWSQVYNTPYAADIENQQKYTPDQPLRPEKGDALNLGFSKLFGKSTNVNMNYALVDMRNAIGRYSIWDDAKGDYQSTSTNIKLRKKAFNTGISHRLSDAWTIKGNFAYASTKKDLTKLSSSYTSYDNLYNSFKYTNKYMVALDYNKGKLNGGIDVNYYTGIDERYFSSNHFTVANLHVNYKLKPEWTVYFVMNNLTNEAYETRANSTYGIGTFPMEGRSFVIGMNYKF